MITFVEHEEYYKHKMPNILENPRRLKVIIKALNDSKILDSPAIKLVSPESVTEEDLKSIHTEQLINTVKHGSMIGTTSITGDTITNEFTFKAALRAVGGTKLAAESALKHENSFAFALVRPPGHHATPLNAMGFCFFNNVAYTANYLVKKRNLKRVAIIDFDNHYGNGTADIFYDRSDVLTISLHSDPASSFPYQGRISEIGEREGEGYNICLPLPNKTGDTEYLQLFDEIVPKVVQEYDPEIILVSAGYDGLAEDPYGFFSLTPSGFQCISERIKRLAEKVCEGKVAYSLEGGYKFNELGNAFLASISPYIPNYQFSKEPEKNLSSSGNKSTIIDSINESRKTLKPYWKMD